MKTRMIVLRFGIVGVILVIFSVWAILYQRQLAPYVGHCSVNSSVVLFQALEESHPVYTQLNTGRGLQSNTIRAVDMTQEGLHIGYGGLENPHAVTFLDKEAWETCQGDNDTTPMGHVNAIDDDWVVTDGNGVYERTGEEWIWHNTSTGLKDDRGYDTAMNPADGHRVVTTYEGITSFDGNAWFDRPDLRDPQGSPHIHNILFHNGEVWLGSIENGLSRRLSNGEWVQYSSIAGEPHAIDSNNIRDIVVGPDGSVWVATDGGGVSHYSYQLDEWIIETLPDNHAMSIAFDLYGRRWVATIGGTFYYEIGGWTLYDGYPAYALAFGCKGCEFDEDTGFIGLAGGGLAQIQVPGR